MPPEPTDPATCPLCGAPVSATDRFCSQCGAAVSASPGETQREPRASGAAPGPAASPPPRRPAGGISQENWAVLAHLSALAPLVLGVPLPFLGPLVVWLLARDRGDFATSQSAEALNFNISWLLWGLAILIAGAAAAVPTLGLTLIPVALVFAAVAIAWLVLVIVAAVAASRGERYRYPLTIRFLS